MSLVASPQRIASAYFVLFGSHGDVARHAHQRGVCRQRLYRASSLLGGTSTSLPSPTPRGREGRRAQIVRRRVSGGRGRPGGGRGGH